MGIVGTIMNIPQAASSPYKLLARTWGMVADVIDHNFETTRPMVRRMHSHLLTK